MSPEQVFVSVHSYKGVGRPAGFWAAPAVQPAPDVGAGGRSRLDYLAYLMIFASLPCSIVFTRMAGY